MMVVRKAESMDEMWAESSAALKVAWTAQPKGDNLAAQKVAQKASTKAALLAFQTVVSWVDLKEEQSVVRMA